jgi:hypothetical protein
MSYFWTFKILSLVKLSGNAYFISFFAKNNDEGTVGVCSFKCTYTSHPN